MKTPFSGVYAALLTPFDRQGRVDDRLLALLVEFLVARRIDGLYVCGSTGEGPLLDIPEREHVVETVMGAAAGRVPVIAHVGGSTNTANAVRLARHAATAGCAAVSSFAPIYFRYSFDEIRAYYERVAGASELPFFIYYIPATTGVSLPNEQIARLASVPAIAGLKYTDADFFVLQDLLARTGGRWIAFSGSDQMFLPGLTMGTVGSIGSTQNVLPELFADIYAAFRENRMAEAAALQRKVTTAVSLLLRHGSMPAWKAAMRLRGVDAGFCREPFTPALSPDAAGSLAAEWRRELPEYCDR